MHSHVFKEENPIYLLTFKMAVPFFILISGYTFSLATKELCFKDMYHWRFLLRHFLRFTIPIMITYVMWLGIRLIGILFLNETSLNMQQIFKTFLLGKYGPGAYYYWIMLGFLLLFPLIRQIVFRYDIHGLFFVGIVNLFYNIFCQYYQISVNINNVLFFRYLLLAAMGVYLYRLYQNKGEIKNEYLLKMLLLGIGYQLLPIYWNYEYKIFTYWSTTSMMISFWVFPIAYILLKHFANIKYDNVIGRMLVLIGKASYHIMCVQIIYFVIHKKLYQLLGVGALDIRIKCFIAIVLSVTGGIVFYFVDNKLFGRLYKKRV